MAETRPGSRRAAVGARRRGERGLGAWWLASARERRPGGGHRREAVAGFMFLAPALAALALFRIVPVIAAITSSFQSTSILASVGTRFVRLSNYADLLTSADFLNSVRVTLVFCAVVVPVQVTAALLLATLLIEHVYLSRLWRLMLFIPFSVPQGVSAIIWQVAFRPDGPLNAILRALSLEPQRFLTSADQALPSIMIIASWVGIGYWMVFLMAGLQDIPSACLEAAVVDGARWWQRFVHVVVPLLRRPLAFVIMADTVSNLLIFAPAQILTSGGPQGTTDFIMFDIFQNAYLSNDEPAASTRVVLLVALMMVIVIFQMRMLVRGEERD